MTTNRPLLLALLVVFAALLGLYTLREIHHADAPGLPLDDSWIHLALARNASDGHGLTTNVGHGTIPATTAPLWTAVLSSTLSLTRSFAAPGDPAAWAAVLAAKGLGIGCGIATLLLTLLVARELLGQRMTAAAVTGLAVFNPRFIWGVLSGLEVPMYVALVMLAVLAQIRLRDRDGPESHLPVLLAALGGWARPELFVLPLLFLFDSYRTRKRGDRRRTEFVRGAAIAASVILVYVTWHWAAYGKPFPTTFYVKAMRGSVLDAGNFLDVLHVMARSCFLQTASLLAFVPFQNLPLSAFCLLGALAITFRPHHRTHTILPTLLLGFGPLVGLLRFSPPEVQYGRYFMHMPVLAVLLGGVGLASLIPDRGTTGRVLPKGRVVQGTIILIALVLVNSLLTIMQSSYTACIASLHYFALNALPATDDPALKEVLSRAQSNYVSIIQGAATTFLLISLAPLLLPTRWRHARGLVVTVLALSALQVGLANWITADNYGRNVRDTNRQHVAAARWADEHVPVGATIAVHDLGAMSFHAGPERTILDLVGIGNPEVLDSARQHGESRVPILQNRRPDYFAGMIDWFAGDFQELLGNVFAPPDDPESPVLPGGGGVRLAGVAQGDVIDFGLRRPDPVTGGHPGPGLRIPSRRSLPFVLTGPGRVQIRIEGRNGDDVPVAETLILDSPRDGIIRPVQTTSTWSLLYRLRILEVDVPDGSPALIKVAPAFSYQPLHVLVLEDNITTAGNQFAIVALDWF